MRAHLLHEPGPVRHFAHLRARQFLVGLAGHDLVDADTADFVVTAGNGPPLRAAVATAGDRPLWLDLPGDPFAEAEAAAALAADPREVVDHAVATVLPALARADAVSVISERQRVATEAMLRTLGRFDVPVFVVPNAMEFDLPPGAPRGPGARVALVGGFNTWFDEDLLASALVGADVVVTSGPIPGHHTAGFERFRARVPARYLGEVPHDQLPTVLADRHVGIVVDRPIREAELGSRTRVLLMLDQGLRVLATPRTELVAGLVAAGLVEPIETAADIVAALASPRPAPDASALRPRLSRAATTRPLRDWTPRRVAPGADPLTTMARVRDAALAELRQVRSSTTWRTLDRINRLRRG